MHLSARSPWFWLLAFGPYAVWAEIWVLSRSTKISFKPLVTWLRRSIFVLAPTYLVVGLMDDHRVLRAGVGSTFFACWGMLLWLQGRYKFETISAPNTKWYARRKLAFFSTPKTLRILVRDIDTVSPWYIEKLGLRKLAQNPWGEEVFTYQFKEDGHFIVLTNKAGFGTERPPMFFTKKITKMKDVLTARGINSGAIERDRQGTRYFEIRDPEGNAIEIVEES